MASPITGIRGIRVQSNFAHSRIKRLGSVAQLFSKFRASLRPAVVDSARTTWLCVVMEDYEKATIHLLFGRICYGVKLQGKRLRIEIKGFK